MTNDVDGSAASDCSIAALRDIHNFAVREKRISQQQCEEAKVSKDFRAADRAASYSLAMQKVVQRITAYSRAMYGVAIDE